MPFYTSLGVGAHLESWGIPPERIVELDWWESATPARARSSRSRRRRRATSRGAAWRRNATLWSSFAVRGPRHAFFFSGDTGLTPEYAEIATRLGPFDLVMLEVGAFHPRWGEIHLGPDNALEAHALLGGGALLPVHWGTFNLAIHAWDEPAETLLRARARARRAPGDAAARRRRRAGARRGRRAVVACRSALRGDERRVAAPAIAAPHRANRRANRLSAAASAARPRSRRGNSAVRILRRATAMSRSDGARPRKPARRAWHEG